MSYLVGKQTAVRTVNVKNCKILPPCDPMQNCSVTVYPSHVKFRTFRLNGRHIQLFHYSLRIPQCENTSKQNKE